MRPRRGNVWVLSEKGLANIFVSEMYQRYDMKELVPAKWVLAGYVIEVAKEELEKENAENECNNIRDTEGEQRVDSEEV